MQLAVFHRLLGSMTPEPNLPEASTDKSRLAIQLFMLQIRSLEKSIDNNFQACWLGGIVMRKTSHIVNFLWVESMFAFSGVQITYITQEGKAFQNSSVIFNSSSCQGHPFSRRC